MGKFILSDDLHSFEIANQYIRAVFDSELGGVEDHVVVVHIAPHLSGILVIIVSTLRIIFLEHRFRFVVGEVFLLHNTRDPVFLVRAYIHIKYIRLVLQNLRSTAPEDNTGLRRHAISVLRMLIEKKIPAKLSRLLNLAYEVERHVPGVSDFREELGSFFYDRVRVMFKDAGYTAQELEAVLALRPDAVMDIPARLAAVRSFEALPEAAALASANKRIGNILKKIEGEVPTEVKPELFEDDAEKALNEAIAAVAPSAEEHFKAGRYEEMLKALAALKAPVDLFFEKVMVNAEDPALRANRQALLAKLHGLMNQVAELSKLAK